MSFDALAPFYRQMEWILAGNLLQRCRTAFLQDAAESRKALLLGEGPGRYLLELLGANPQVAVTCLDSSRRMQQVAQARARNAGFSDRQVRFVCSDWAEWTGAGGPFDLIAAHFFFDCFRPDQLARLIPQISALASPHACWVVSDFRLPARGWQRMRARLVIRLAYGFFRLTTGLSASRVAPVGPLLEAAGFKLRRHQLFNHGLLHADLWQRTAVGVTANCQNGSARTA